MTHRRRTAPLFLLAATLLGALPAMASQEWRDKKLYFGDAHWHSCLSQDASATLDSQYASMVEDYGLDFALESDHAEAASKGVSACAPYLPFVSLFYVYGGEDIATAMKTAADTWTGVERTSSAGPIKFVAFPGYEWAPDARCWQSSFSHPVVPDVNGNNNTPGHINYFFDRTTGWTYHNDVWEPGDGDSDFCAFISDLGFTYYTGSKDWVDELLGQLIHQRDDPDRDYDLMIQYNHPASSLDKGGSSDYLAK